MRAMRSSVHPCAFHGMAARLVVEVDPLLAVRSERPLSLDLRTRYPFKLAVENKFSFLH